MKKKKYLPLYYEWMRTGNLPQNGLCNCFGTSLDETMWLPNDGFEDFNLMFPKKRDDPYWAVGECRNDANRHREFTPLRQTFVLFMAAINDEL